MFFLPIAETSDQPQELPSNQLNNNKHNVPLLSGIEVAVLGFVSFARTLALGILDSMYGETDKFIVHKLFLLRKLSFSMLFCFILPIMYLYNNIDLRQFIVLRIFRRIFPKNVK